MDYILSSHTEPHMGYLITHGQTTLDLKVDEKVLSYGLSFWEELFRYITDDMYINPLKRKIVKKFYLTLQNTENDFVIQVNDHDSLQRVGDEIYYNYR